MGDYLHKELGSKLYTIGFTSLEGNAGSVIKYKLKTPPVGSIEFILGSTGASYGFIDFQGSGHDQILKSNDVKSTGMLGNKFIYMTIDKVVSALFYIRERTRHNKTAYNIALTHMAGRRASLLRQKP